MNDHTFYRSCVGWPQDDVLRDGGLSDMINTGLDISRRTFLKHVDRDNFQEVVSWFGVYAKHPSQGLTFAADWAVSYHRGKLHGYRVYFFKHSGIEYVFVPNNFQ